MKLQLTRRAHVVHNTGILVAVAIPRVGTPKEILNLGSLAPS